jgi:hypothetical protein
VAGGSGYRSVAAFVSRGLPFACPKTPPVEVDLSVDVAFRIACRAMSFRSNCACSTRFGMPDRAYTPIYSKEAHVYLHTCRLASRSQRGDSCHQRSMRAAAKRS